MNQDVSLKDEEQRQLRDVTSLRDAVSELFDGFFGGRSPLSVRHLQADSGLGWSPAVNVRETDDAILIYAALPGVEKADVSIEMKDNHLILSGKTRQMEPEDGWLRRELPAGQFFRAFALSADVKADQVKASLKNGVLEITLPKAEEEKPRKVSID